MLEKAVMFGPIMRHGDRWTELSHRILGERAIQIWLPPQLKPTVSASFEHWKCWRAPEVSLLLAADKR